jgi:osmoprotectant transport system permease protein
MKNLIFLILLFCLPGNSPALTVASKKFTENIILAEILAGALRQADIEVIHKRELGGTRILWDALLNSDIDIYPEYTGTLIFELLSTTEIVDHAQLENRLAAMGVGISAPLGFSNNYVLGMIDIKAQQLAVRRISDLQKYPLLRFGFSNEFMARADGWPGLRAHYNLPQQDVRGLDHDLAYRGLDSGMLDLIDLYATDAEIAYYNIRPLEDDRSYFPDYQALFIYRMELPAEIPALGDVLHNLSGRISRERMTLMNAAVKLQGNTETGTAARFLQEATGNNPVIEEDTVLRRLVKHTSEHLLLVGVSLGAAILVAIPLGIAAVYLPRFGSLVLGAAGIIQTIPSLALLVFMIPLLGIGEMPAIVALFLYSLLPIIRNTCSGLQDIPAPIRESATALGLPFMTQLGIIELPLAMRSIMAGIKTSAVINVGTATLGALIGAGGYGQPIITGIRLNDTGLILEGAVPAAILALLVQVLLGMLEHRMIPAGVVYRKQV